jgi:hypothetical protein
MLTRDEMVLNSGSYRILLVQLKCVVKNICVAALEAG